MFLFTLEWACNKRDIKTSDWLNILSFSLVIITWRMITGDLETGAAIAAGEVNTEKLGMTHVYFTPSEAIRELTN